MVIWVVEGWGDAKLERFLPSTYLKEIIEFCSSDREKLLKFEAEGREFAKFLGSLERFIQTVKGQNKFW